MTNWLERGSVTYVADDDCFGRQRIQVHRQGRAWYVTRNDSTRRYEDDTPLAGPFKDLDAAKAALLVIRAGDA